MPDAISQIHLECKGSNGRLKDNVNAGNFQMSIQMGDGYACDPRIDGLAPYLYDTFEVAVYPYVPKPIAMKFASWKMDELDIYLNLPKKELQILYDMLCQEK